MLGIMMSSRHIRGTKIKHEFPPSVGWVLSLGLKTAVTHERNAHCASCTEAARTVNAHTRAQRFYARRDCVTKLFAFLHMSVSVQDCLCMYEFYFF